MCCPVFLPQIVGGLKPPGLVMVKESVMQSPIIVDGLMSTVAGVVGSYVAGPAITMVS